MVLLAGSHDERWLDTALKVRMVSRRSPGAAARRAARMPPRSARRAASPIGSSSFNLERVLERATRAEEPGLHRPAGHAEPLADRLERKVLEMMERQERPIGKRQAVERPLQHVEVGGPIVVRTRRDVSCSPSSGSAPTEISRTVRRRRPRIAVRQVLTTILPNQAANDLVREAPADSATPAERSPVWHRGHLLRFRGWPGQSGRSPQAERRRGRRTRRGRLDRRVARGPFRPSRSLVPPGRLPRRVSPSLSRVQRMTPLG